MFSLNEKRLFFSTHLATVFFTFTSDPVSNVRVVFAEMVLKHQGMNVVLTEAVAFDSCSDAANVNFG